MSRFFQGSESESDDSDSGAEPFVPQERGRPAPRPASVIYNLIFHIIFVQR